MANFTIIIGNKNYSSWSLRAWLALKQTGAEFEEVRIPLDTPETHQQILRYSPSGRVPALLHDGVTIWDSLAICEYLAEQFPDCQLLPSDTTARAIARSVSAEMHAGFAPLRQHLPMDCRARFPAVALRSDVQADVDRITALWRTCRQQFGGAGKFLFGHFTIADAMFAPVVSRFVTYSVSLDPEAQAYADAIWSLPTLQAWVAAAVAETEVIPVSKL